MKEMLIELVYKSGFPYLKTRARVKGDGGSAGHMSLVVLGDIIAGVDLVFILGYG